MRNAWFGQEVENVDVIACGCQRIADEVAIFAEWLELRFVVVDII